MAAVGGGRAVGLVPGEGKGLKRGVRGWGEGVSGSARLQKAAAARSSRALALGRGGLGQFTF